MATYKGKFIPRNPQKYQGDVANIVYRSLWERNVMRWMDSQSFIARWSSEEVIVPYRCKTDGQIHRYFVDIKAEFVDGRVILIEVKPEKETKPPKPPKVKTRRYITEVMTYAKNLSKWEAATAYAEDRGWKFEVWNENVLKSFGIRVL